MHGPPDEGLLLLLLLLPGLVRLRRVQAAVHPHARGRLLVPVEVRLEQCEGLAAAAAGYERLHRGVGLDVRIAQVGLVRERLRALRAEERLLLGTAGEAEVNARSRRGVGLSYDKLDVKNWMKTND